MRSLVPYLTFRHGARSLEFLVTGLGFEIVAEQRAENTGDVIHAELRCGDAVVMGGSGDDTPSSTPGLYLVVDDHDLDADYARAISAGGETVYPPQTTEWGTRRARLRDLDGHEWTLGTYLPGGTT